MMDFAKYAFNKSHAAAYAVVAYQTAWLKYYYPVEFMASLMTSVMDNSTKVSEYTLTCRKMNIEILPPDINEGEGGFSVAGNAIRYGLSAIKGVGRPVIETIIAEREANGAFSNLEDFCSRLNGRELNKRTIENFIKAGAMDGLEGTRKQKIMIYSAIDVYKRQGTVKTADGREMSFQIKVEMSRSFTSYMEIRVDFGAARVCDPLVINLNISTAQVTDQKFYFD